MIGLEKNINEANKCIDREHRREERERAYRRRKRAWEELFISDDEKELRRLTDAKKQERMAAKLSALLEEEGVFDTDGAGYAFIQSMSKRSDYDMNMLLVVCKHPHDCETTDKIVLGSSLRETAEKLALLFVLLSKEFEIHSIYFGIRKHDSAQCTHQT